MIRAQWPGRPDRMKRMLGPGIVFAGLLLLAACGQTGPLYLPDPVDEPSGPAQSDDEETDERGEER
jgi:predicted small lipoprotein YifL